MINEQQKEVIKQSELLIDTILKASILNLIHDTCENINDNNYNDDSKTFECINDLKLKVSNYTLDINKILELSLSKRDTYLKELFKTKNLILDIYNSTFLCITYFKQKLKYITMDIFIKENDDLEVEYKDVATLLRDCMVYATMQKESILNSMSMAKIMSLLPLKMTKMKYSDYVRESLNSMFSAANTDLVRRMTETLKYKFAPSKFENLKKYHSDTIEEIDKLIELYKNSSKDERDKKVKKPIENLIIKLDYSMSLCSMMYNDINYILNIASLCIDEEFLFNI